MGVSDSNIEVPCPECGRAIRVRLRDVSTSRLVSCSAGHRVKLKEQGNGIRQMDRAERDLKRTIDKLKRDTRRRR